jgi:hypothetical protein
MCCQPGNRHGLPVSETDRRRRYSIRMQPRWNHATGSTTDASPHAPGLEGKDAFSSSGRGRKMPLTSPLIDQAITLIEPSASPRGRGFECNGDISTSLPTSDVSRNFCYLISLFRAHLSSQRRHTGSFRESSALASSMIYIQPHGLGPFLHHCGGAAHQTSLRSPSIMMCYANSPSCGEAGSLFS